MAEFEYRVCWEASSNITFHGESGWAPWDGDEETTAEVEDALGRGGVLSHGLEEALDCSGFGWMAEVREVTPDA